jgi:hypothetical protein
MANTMTLAEARKLLTPPLIFGKDAQIKAVRFMEQVDEALETYEKCEEEHESYSPHDPESRFDIGCDCLDPFRKETKDAAKQIWRERR